MGIPTVNGAVFEPGYTANPLVYCGCIGILPTGTHKTEPQVGDRVVVIGGKTGRDGIAGNFSSMEMSHETGEIAGSSVQIGHPINEKQAQEVVMLAMRVYTMPSPIVAPVVYLRRWARWLRSWAPISIGGCTHKVSRFSRGGVVERSSRAYGFGGARRELGRFSGHL